ncbi:MAG: response regulator [Candidatus Paceibacterota bacterium]|jgi:two-component system alkaline phosphatase synthesis response regulator PhoP
MEKIKKILIVEDEIAFRKVFGEEFKMREKGIKVLSADTGEMGLKIALEEHPDLIFLDVILPIMNGIEVLKKLRIDDWGKTATVILLTQVDDLGHVAEAVENGVSKYFIKSDQSIPDIIDQTSKYLADMEAGK